jgi:hypothetical protein
MSRRITAALAAAAVTLILASGGASGRSTAPGQQLPKNQTLPSVSGTALVPNTLTAGTGTWQGKGLKFAYQWLRCDSAGASCSAITGATGSAETLSTADAARTLRVIVTASNQNGSTAATSAQTTVVAQASSPPPPSPDPSSGTSPVAPSDSSLPVVSGTAQQNQTLSTSTGSWSGTTPLTYAYQWQRCGSGGGSCVPISGATAASYVLAAADVGSTLRASVTASNSAGSATASSDATTVVGALPTASSSSPSSCNGCYFDWEGDAIPGKWPGMVPSPLSSSWMFPVDNGAATAIKITTGGSPSGSNGTIASLYFGSGGQSGQHTANGESAWYRMRVRFPSGSFVATVGDWNMVEEWHTQFGCGALSSFVGVRGSGSNSSQPATGSQLVLALRGGSPTSGTCPNASTEIRVPDPAPLLYDHWYDIVVHFVWKPAGGSVEWYVDGQRIYQNASFPTLLTSNGQVDQPGFGVYNYRMDAFAGSSEVDFDQTLIGPSASSVGFTP